MNRHDMTVGLFGTCGGSRWRDAFIAEYARLNIPYFNPQVDNWVPECAEEEAWHLANDQLILFPVTAETYGLGSLAETGFSIFSALRWNANRFVVVFIEEALDARLKESNPEAAKESMRARRLVTAHLARAQHPNVFVVDSLEAMLPVSVRLFFALELIAQARSALTKAAAGASDPSWLEKIGPYRGVIPGV